MWQTKKGQEEWDRLRKMGVPVQPAAERAKRFDKAEVERLERAAQGHKVDWESMQGGLAQAKLHEDEDLQLALFVRLPYDQDYDMSWLGEYTSRPDDDCLKRKRVEFGEHTHFRPANSVEEYAKGYTDLGWPKRVALAQAKLDREDDMRQAEEINSNAMVYVEVVIEHNGAEIASNAVGNFSVCDTDDWFMVEDEIPNIAPDAYRRAIREVEAHAREALGVEPLALFPDENLMLSMSPVTARLREWMREDGIRF